MTGVVKHLYISGAQKELRARFSSCLVFSGERERVELLYPFSVVDDGSEVSLCRLYIQPNRFLEGSFLSVSSSSEEALYPS